jgi:putative membrane protein
MRLLLSLAINTLAVLTGSYLLRGIHIENVTTAMIVAIVVGVLNAFLKPILVLLTLPLTLLTLGLFLFVINALLIILAGKLIPGFAVDNFWWALLFSFIISIVASFLNSLV